MQTVTLITDGSADNRTRKGGWCAIIRTSTALTELTGHAVGTTSNRMELTAVIEGLKAITVPSIVHVVADSAYVLNSIKNGWYEGWMMEQYPSGKPRPNLDLWCQLAGLLQFHHVVPIKVKGHSGDYWNERADRLASIARKSQSSGIHTVPNFIERRCEDVAKSGRQCKLHDGHTGYHQWCNGKGANGIVPYGMAITTAVS
jgi:ribonuclease HI